MHFLEFANSGRICQDKAYLSFEQPYSDIAFRINGQMQHSILKSEAIMCLESAYILY